LVGAAAEALQLSESAVVGTLGRIDAALKAREAVANAAVDITERSIFIQFGERHFAGALHFMHPHFGFEA
jgi:hypothetical protein